MQILSFITYSIFVGSIVLLVLCLFLNFKKPFFEKVKEGVLSLLLVATSLFIVDIFIDGIKMLKEIYIDDNPFTFKAWAYMMLGPLGWASAAGAILKATAPQIFWFRRSKKAMLVVAILLTIGVYVLNIVLAVLSSYSNNIPAGLLYNTSSFIMQTLICLSIYLVILTVFVLLREKIITYRRSQVS